MTHADTNVVFALLASASSRRWRAIEARRDGRHADAAGLERRAAELIEDAAAELIEAGISGRL